MTGGWIEPLGADGDLVVGLFTAFKQDTSLLSARPRGAWKVPGQVVYARLVK